MICERHKEMVDTVEDLECRVVSLEISRAETKIIVKTLCEEMKELVKWIKALVGTGGVALIGFLLWYIQSLPR